MVDFHEICKDCAKINNIYSVLGFHKETLDKHEKKICDHDDDISFLKEERKETKIYVKIILEEINDIKNIVGELRKEREQEKKDRLLFLEKENSDIKKSIKIAFINQLPFILKATFVVVLLTISIVAGINLTALGDFLRSFAF